MTSIYSSVGPVFELGGTVVGELARDVTRLEIDEATDGLKTLSAELVAIGPHGNDTAEALLYLDGSSVDFGKTIDVAIGPGDDQRKVFHGKISAIEAVFCGGDEPHVVLFAEDALMELRTTRRSRTYKQQSDADIAKKIAGDHHLSADVAADGPTYEMVQQFNQSDLAFLRSRARRIQAELWIQDTTLNFKTRGNRSAPGITLVQGDDLLDVRLRADLAEQRTKVTVSGYDANGRTRISEDAGTDAIMAEISGGRTGPSILSSAFGDRSSFRVRDVPLTTGEARAWARAEMLRRCRAFVTVSGITSGSPDMVVGSALTLNNVGAPFTGAGYYATRVRHTYDLVEGFRTHFDAERSTVNAK